MKNYISIDTIKPLLDSQLNYYDFRIGEGKSPYRWNYLTFLFYEDEKEEEKTIKMELLEVVKKLCAIYSKEEPTTVIVDNVVHHLYGTEYGYDGMDISIKYITIAEEEEEDF